MTWDGSTLSVAVAEGLIVIPYFNGPQPPGAPPRADCARDPDQPNVLSCTTVGPSSQVVFTTLAPPPTGALTLPYTDSQGSGTLTIANSGGDVSSGGATVAVTLAQGEQVWVGEGVMRPQPQARGIKLDFSVADPQGGTILFEGSLSSTSGAWSAEGLKYVVGDSASTQQWSTGPLAPLAGFGEAVVIQAGAAPAAFLVSPPPPPPPPPPPLPMVPASAAIVGGVGGERPGNYPETAGSVGRAVMFTAVTTFPWGLPDPTLSHQWQWEFGDGSQSPESDRQTVSHAYGAPGTYDVAVIVTDSTGISTFGSAEIAISAP